MDEAQLKELIEEISDNADKIEDALWDILK